MSSIPFSIRTVMAYDKAPSARMNNEQLTSIIKDTLKMSSENVRTE